jgi:hypothetical protein
VTISGTDGTNTHTVNGSVTVWTGPVQQWKMNEGSSPMADSSGHSNNLTNTNATYTNIAGLLPNTLTFNGTNTTSVATNATNTAFNGLTPFTLCGWFNRTSGGAESYLIQNLNGSSAGYLLELEGTGGGTDRLRFWMLSSGSNLNRVAYSYGATAGTAFQVCAIDTGTYNTNGMLAYINGASVSQYSVEQNGLNASIASTTPVSVGYTALVGGAAGVMIWNYQLSQTQITALYGLGVQ